VTEGQLRALHRRVAPPEPGFEALGPRHSLERADGQELKPGELAELRIAMQPTAVVIRAGHRLRLAIAGHDASTFHRIPETGDPEIRVYRNGADRSFIEVPARPR
jgi:uncharacterized protein